VEIRDPIHGLIEYSSLEERVINSRAFQRLRGIHQLAMAYLVYPGALHTRFDHSLGVMHVAGEMAASLNARYGDELFGSEDRDTIRLAALLHDVGHGPFSHVSETPLAALSQDQELLRQQKISLEKLHEQVTVDIVTHDRELRAILGERRLEIARIIGHQGLPNVSQSIVSGPLDADKLDYLLRDSHFCGVKYGVYDLERVLDGLRVVEAPWHDSYLGVAEESVPAIEQHLMARYQMTRQVYRHRIRRSTDALLARAIIAAAAAGCEELYTLYTYGGDPEGFCRNWLCYDDRRVIDTILARCHGTDAALLVNRLIGRRLPLHVCEMDLENAGDVFLQSKLAKPDRRSELEHRVADHLDVRPCEVIVDLVQTNPPKPSSAEPDIDPEAIYVETETEVRSFRQVSDIFRENPLSGRKRLVIFAPFSGVAKRQRDEERERLSEQVREVMAQWGKEA
jgi:HD superfamily phosphohydrolase